MSELPDQNNSNNSNNNDNNNNNNNSKHMALIYAHLSLYIDLHTKWISYNCIIGYIICIYIYIYSHIYIYIYI